MVLKKLYCAKCGGSNISHVTSRLPRRGGASKADKHYPENDPSGDKLIKPMTDFNHPYYCNSCGHYFGGRWDG